MSNDALRNIAGLLQQKADLLDEKNHIDNTLVALEPLIQKAQKDLIQATCRHPEYKEIYANTDNKYSGWGEYECIVCGHRKQTSW